MTHTETQVRIDVLMQKFKDHQYHPITLDENGQTAVWCGRNPDMGGIYGFTVIIRPATLFMYGDIYDLVVHPMSASRDAQDTWSWVRGSVRNLEYVSEKVPHVMRACWEKYDENYAREVVQQHMSELASDGYSDETIDKLREAIETAYTIDDFHGAYFDVFNDHEIIPDLMTWNPQFLLQVAALADMASKVKNILPTSKEKHDESEA